ncbi:MAG: hypothetical protein IPJ65_33480 [Archangiaceae bacterium]|nr:hypothetical protein [Archangiaceae bacterium]
MSSFFAIYTDGAAPRADVSVPRGIELSLTQQEQLVTPQDVSLFGPHAAESQRYKPKAGYLLSLLRDTKGSAGTFFADAQRVLADAVAGLEGWGLDVLRMYPFPLGAARELPEDPFPEDLISVGFHEQGEHGFRAETFGLSKLGQREISFTFKGGELLEDAAILCSHLADYAMSQGRRVENRQTMSFGFDKLLFLAAEGENHTGPFRGWHPPFMSRLLPERLFYGVGALKVLGFPRPTAAAQADLTPVLHRALEQRMVLEEYDLTGESPHQSTTARICACAGGSDGLRGERREPQSQKESGWTFSCMKEHVPAELHSRSLEEVSVKVPEVMKYLALPPGVSLTFTVAGVEVDAHRARRDDEPDTDDL